jgi:hypothetical protein
VPFDAETLSAAERLEAEALADRARAAAGTDGNPLGVALERLGGATLTIYSRLDHPLINRVVGLGVSEPAFEVDVGSIIDAYRLRGIRRFSVALSGEAQPPELPAWLARAGFAPRGGTARWLRATGEIPDVDPEVQVVEATADDAPAVVEIVTLALGLPPPAGLIVSAAIGRPGWKHYLAYVDGEPAGAGALYARQEMAWIGFGGTVADARGRGAHKALIARRCADAAAAGCRVVTAESSNSDEYASFRNLRRSGFELAGMRPIYVYEG